MRVAEKSVQGQIALALAHLCAPDDRKAIFLDNNGRNSGSASDAFIPLDTF